MSISDGQNASADNLNAAFASKVSDNTLSGKQTLSRPGSGDSIVDVQQAINDNTSGLAQAQTDIVAMQDDVENAVTVATGADTRLSSLEEGLPSGDDYLQLEELSSDPSAPSAGKKRLFAKNDGKVYTRDSAGNIAEVGSGAGGAGGINYFEGGDFETNLDLATTYDDGGAYVDGTGGSPSVITKEEESTLPLFGEKSLRIAKAASDASGEGVTFLSETIDIAYRGKPLFIRFLYDASAGAYPGGDLQVKAYDVTNSQALTVFPVANLDDDGGLLNAENLQAMAKIYPSSNTAQVRVSLHLASDSNTGQGWAVNVDEVKLGPDSPTPTATIVDHGTETWADSWANTTTSVKIQQVGKRVFLEGQTTLSGTPTNAALTVTVPSKFTPKASWYGRKGRAELLDAGTATYNGTTIISTNSLEIRVDDTSSTYLSSSTLNQTTPFTWASGDSVRWWVDFESDELSSGNLMSSFEASQQSLIVRAYKNAGSHGSSGSYLDLADWTKTDDNFNAFDATTGIFTPPKAGTYIFAGAQGFSNGSGVIVARVTDTSNTDIIGLGQVSNNSTSSGTTVPLNGSVELDANEQVKIRTFQNSGGSLTYSSGAASGTLTITRKEDFTHTGAYSEAGEVFPKTGYSSGGLQTYSITAGQYGDLDSVELPPGEYSWHINGVLNSTGATTTGNFILGLGTVSGNDSTGIFEGETASTTIKNSTSGARDPLSVSGSGLVVTTPTTYYLKGFAGTSITNLQLGWSWRFTKIK